MGMSESVLYGITLTVILLGILIPIFIYVSMAELIKIRKQLEGVMTNIDCNLYILARSKSELTYTPAGMQNEERINIAKSIDDVIVRKREIFK